MADWQTISNKLFPIFADMDREFIAGQIEWALKRKEALTIFKASDEYQAMRRDAWQLYPRMFAICGGKTWYNIINYGNAASITEDVTKNCNRIIETRNANIAFKLTKIGITEVLSSDYGRTNDGFNGTFVVITDTGRKIVTINTIIAGGHNVQCLHQRTLIKVR